MKIDKNNAVEPLFKNYERTIHLFLDRRLRSCTCFECNDSFLKKLSSFVWTDKWLICLPKFNVSFKLCTQLWTAYFDPDYPTAGLARIHCCIVHLSKRAYLFVTSVSTRLRGTATRFLYPRHTSPNASRERRTSQKHTQLLATCSSETAVFSVAGNDSGERHPRNKSRSVESSEEMWPNSNITSRRLQQ
jgi:hypothetical protein